MLRHSNDKSNGLILFASSFIDKLYSLPFMSSIRVVGILNTIMTF